MTANFQMQFLRHLGIRLDLRCQVQKWSQAMKETALSNYMYKETIIPIYVSHVPNVTFDYREFSRLLTDVYLGPLV